jgi:hypothetical protein
MSSPRASSRLFCRAVVAASVLALAACGGGGGGEKKANNSKATKQTITVPGGKVTLRLASIDVQSTGNGVRLGEKTKVAVMMQARKYVEEAIVRPLLSGKQVQARYAALFAPGVLAAATHQPDRGALTDEHVGKVSGDVTAPATNVAMHALVAGGTVQYIATDFNLHLSSKLGSVPVSIGRSTELTFQRSPSGKWLVTAYRITTTRNTGSAGATKTTTKTTEKP